MMKKLFFILFLFIGLSASAQQLKLHKDSIDQTTELKIITMKKGNGSYPVKGQKVKVYYTGRLSDGSIFDSNTESYPFRFTLGKGEVIAGWDEGFLKLSKGEKAVLIIPANKAYGIRGVPSEDGYLVPPNAVLLFEVTLVDFK